MKASDWIKVTDQLPEPDEDVLVYDDMYGVEVASYASDYGWLHCEYNYLENVTHWMPLVLPEKELMNKEQFTASELIKRINELIEKHGDVSVAVRTEEGTFAVLGCYYDIFVESIIISE